MSEARVKVLEPTFAPWSPTRDRARQVAVLMSGGVDSSVTALLLVQADWDVLGITMKVPVCDSNPRGCCGAEAAFVCQDLGIPHYFVDVTEAFRALIIEPFRQAYREGRTPNPCIDCNSLMKFSLVWDLLEQEFGIQHLATGHYACVVRTLEDVRLCRARDKAKDQSYFLYGIPRDRLNYLDLPLGGLSKQEVRRIARDRGLPVADRPESMELCFVGEGDYRQALDDDLRRQYGDLIDMQGNKIGTHRGIAHYTLGQRRGLGYAGGRPLYVARIDPAANTVTLGTRDQVCTRLVTAGHVHALYPKACAAGQQVRAKIRSYGDPKPCRIVDFSADYVTVRFEEPEFAPCPGQGLVIYDDQDCVIAGGTIHEQTPFQIARE